MLSLLVAFTGVNYQSVGNYFSGILFPKADFTIVSWTNSTILPYYDFMPSLSVSPAYLVVTSVNLKSDQPYLGDPLQFTISFENKGKKPVEQPRVVIYFVDFEHRVWQTWNRSDASSIVAKGCSIDYYFPSLDQKTVGSWSILVMLYDDANGTLVSYEMKQFGVTDVAPNYLWQYILGGLTVLPIAVVIVFRFWRYKKVKEIDKEVEERIKRMHQRSMDIIFPSSETVTTLHYAQ